MASVVPVVRAIIICGNIMKHDAVGMHALYIGDLFKREGYEVEFYAENWSPGLNISSIDSFANLSVQASDIIFISHSIYLHCLPQMLDLGAFKVVYYHGITDPSLFIEAEVCTSVACKKGLLQLELFNKADLLIANSRFTASKLAPKVPGREIVVFPPTSGSGIWKDVAESRSNHIKKDSLKLLYVGRITNHKGILDALSFLGSLRDNDQSAELSVVGSFSSEEMKEMVLSRIDQLCLNNLVSFKGIVPLKVLVDLYRNSDLLLVFSKDEGFCVPILEALLSGLPVIARKGTACDELVNNEELCFTSEVEALQCLQRLEDTNFLSNCVKVNRLNGIQIEERGDEIINYIIANKPV